MRGKKAICMMLAGMMLAGCASGAQDADELKDIKIGITVYNQYDTFVSELVDEIVAYTDVMEEKYEISITLEILNASSNQVTQNDQMDYFIERECDIVCVNLVDRTDASTIIERGKSADLPIIFFNRELVEEDLQRWDKLYYVGADAFESGIIQGEVLIKKLEADFDSVDKNGDGILQYVMLEGEAGHQDSIIRTMYVLNTVSDAGYQLEKLADEIANWNRDQGKTKMNQWLDAFGTEIEVVFANNDDMALGAIDALKEHGYFSVDESLQEPIVLGIDGTKPALEAVEKDELFGTVLNDSVGQAHGMLELAYAVVSGNELDENFELLDGKYIRLPYQEISK